MSRARDERRSLCETLLEIGPDAPTLCDGWDARDLAAHLVLRERHPDAVLALGLSASGLPGTGLATRHAESVRHRVTDQEWTGLVQQVRSGPPRWNPARLGPVDEQVNVAEFFVHHEDLRRAQAGWTPRATADLAPSLWRACRFVGRMALRHAPVGIELVATGHGRCTVHRGDQVVQVLGDPAEILLFAFGRRAVARVELDGPPDAVRLLRNSTTGI